MKVSCFVFGLCVSYGALATASFAQTASQDPAVPDAPAAQDAETANDGYLEMLVVTAQRRSQQIQDVPVAVSLYSGDELQQRQINSSIELARTTPGVYASGASAGQISAYAIRGVVQNDVSGTAEGPIAVYVDDAYAPNVQAQGFPLYDLERVEILKGPQGTLFGRNSTGGLVNFVIVKPGDSFSGYANATYGAYDTVKLEGAVGGPIAEGVMARASGFYHRNGNYLENLFPGAADQGQQETISGRLQLLLEPTDRLSLRLSGSVSDQDFSSAPYNQISTRSITDGDGNVVGGVVFDGPDFFGFTAPDGDDLQINSDYACENCGGVQIYKVGLHADYDLGAVGLNSISIYQKVENHVVLGADLSPVNLASVGFSGTTESFSQELRALGETDRLVWNVGAYYLNILSNTANGFLAPRDSIFAGLFGLGPTGVDLLNNQRLRTQSYSLFAQVEYKFAEQFSVIVGVRGIHERQRYDFSSSAFANADDFTIDTDTALFTLQPSFSDREKENLWAAKISLQYMPHDDLLAYATISRGVKGGNFNEQLPSGAPPLDESDFYFRPEVLLNYEIGLKTSLWDDRLMLDASGYYYDYTDYQALVFSNLSGFIENKDATIYGGELQVTLRPVRGLEIRTGFAYVHARIKDLEIAPGITSDEVIPPFSPSLQFSGRVAYTPDLEVAGGEITLAVDAYSTSHFFHNIRNFDSHRLDGYTTLGAQLTWEHYTGFSLTAAAVNLTDKRYGIVGFDVTDICGCSQIAYGQPRWWTITAGYRF